MTAPALTTASLVTTRPDAGSLFSGAAIPPMIQLRNRLSPSQLRAIAAGTPVEGLADIIEAACDAAGRQGSGVVLPCGAFDLRRMIKLHPRCWLIAETPASFPRATYNPGLARDVGVTLVKNHNDPAILHVRGEHAYATCAGIVGIALSGNPAAARSNRGDGIVIERVGGYALLGLRLFSIPRDGLVLGVNAEDDTGQIVLEDVYVNNPGRYAILNRSKWLKAARLSSDGGLRSYSGEAAPNADITQFHFEGASEVAIVLDGANGNTRFRAGFIGMTNAAARTAIRLASAAGNTDVTFRDVQIVGHDGLDPAIDIGSAAWRASILDCEISSAALGVLDLAVGTVVRSKFVETGLPIVAAGQSSDYSGSSFVATRGQWGIEHRGGGGGLWSGIRTDRPFRSIVPGPAGSFGSNVVKDNPGFRTAFGALTAAATAPIKVAHLLMSPPVSILVSELDARENAAPYVLSVDSTAITLDWRGGGTRRFSIDARTACERP